MDVCWIVPRGEGGHVRVVGAEERTVLLGEGYEDFRLTCITPSGARDGTLYDQAWKSSEELSSHVEQAGFALFGGCTTIQVHRPGSAVPIALPHADLTALMGVPTMRE